MLAILALLACWTAPLQKLAPELAARDAARIHIAREARFASVWEHAPADRRAAAVERLSRLRIGRAQGLTTSIDRSIALAEAWRALQGGPSPVEQGGALAAVVDALDLRVVPGGFSARGEGLGEAMTIHVRPLFHTAVDVPVELTLYWRSLADGSEQRARSEPIPPEAFTSNGFEMYVRPPASAPGRFELVPELSLGDARVRGFPTTVDCAAELERRARALEELANQGDALARSLRDGFASRLRYGVRTLEGLSVEDGLRLALGEGAPDGPLRIVDGPQGTPLWSRAGVDAARPRVLLIATAAPEHPTDVLGGAVGQAWEELARSLDAQLLATDLPALTSGGTDLVALLGELRTERALEELAVVARGESGVLLLPRLRGAEGAALVDRLLLQASLATRRPPLAQLGLGMPVLSIDTSAERDAATTGGEAPAAWCWLQRQVPESVLEREVPALYAAWLAGEFAPVASDGERAPR